MSKTKKIKSPTQMELVEPTFAALVKLGGSATVDEICEKVIDRIEVMPPNRQNWSINLHGREPGLKTMEPLQIANAAFG